MRSEALPILARSVPKPYDPILAGTAMEKSISEGDRRLYSGFAASPNFGGSVKAFAIGCNLRCGFCWSPCRSKLEITRLIQRRTLVAAEIHTILGPSVGSLAADEELDQVELELLGPLEVVDRMVAVHAENSASGIAAFDQIAGGPIPSKLRYYTLTGGEPTLCRDHLLAVIREFRRRSLAENFLIQTHGMQLGADPSYLQALRPHAESLEIRISMKAGTPASLSRLTGARPESFNLPLQAIEQLLESTFSFHLAAMLDGRVATRTERENLIRLVSELCSDHGARLRVHDDLSGRVTLRGRLRNAVRQVDLDLESYQPEFPAILNRTIEEGRIHA